MRLPINGAASRFAVLAGQAKGHAFTEEKRAWADTIQMYSDRGFITIVVRINGSMNINAGRWNEIIGNLDRDEPVNVAGFTRCPFILIVFAPV